MLMNGKGCEKNEFLAAFCHCQSANMNNENAIVAKQEFLARMCGYTLEEMYCVF